MPLQKALTAPHRLTNSKTNSAFHYFFQKQLFAEQHLSKVQGALRNTLKNPMFRSSIRLGNVSPHKEPFLPGVPVMAPGV